MRQLKQFTIYDAMENAGIFEKNPANVGARNHEGQNIYKGPLAFPKMLYDPTGKERILVPATAEQTPFGPKMMGEQREIITQVVENAETEAKLLAEGWLDHPAKAIAAGNKQRALNGEAILPVPAIHNDSRISELEAKIKALQDEITKAEQNQRIGAALGIQGKPIKTTGLA